MTQPRAEEGQSASRSHTDVKRGSSAPGDHYKWVVLSNTTEQHVRSDSRAGRDPDGDRHVPEAGLDWREVQDVLHKDGREEEHREDAGLCRINRHPSCPRGVGVTGPTAGVSSVAGEHLSLVAVHRESASASQAIRSVGI